MSDDKYGRPGRRLTLWLGSDSEGPDRILANGTGYAASREDGKVLISCADEDESLEVFILPGLFPGVEAALDACYARQGQHARQRARSIREQARAALTAFQGASSVSAEHEAALVLASLLESLLEEGGEEPARRSVPFCAACGGRLERSEQEPQAGYLHTDDSDDDHVPVPERA